MCQEFYYGQQISFKQQQGPNTHCLTSLLRTTLMTPGIPDGTYHPILLYVSDQQAMGGRIPCELCCVGASFKPLLFNTGGL